MRGRKDEESSGFDNSFFVKFVKQTFLTCIFCVKEL